MLNEKIAVITGASSGIGAALSTLLAKEKATVVIGARRVSRLDEQCARIRSAGGNCIAVQWDVTERADAERLVNTALTTFGRIDILVNNAGQGHFASVEDTTDDIIYKMFAVNVFPLWYTTRPVLPSMRRRGSGHIINIASMAGKIGYPYNSAYVAAKHACVGFTHALRQELAETGIHATVVCPAGVATNWANVTEGGSMLTFFSESGQHVKRIARQRGISLPPIEGVKKPEEIAEAILECIDHPVPEVYTHKGSMEFVQLAAQDRVQAELQQLPVVLGEREVYQKIKGVL